VRRTIGVLAAGLLILAGAIGAGSAHAASWTSASYSSRLVQLVDQAREQNGLSALTVASGTSQVAAAWTAHLDATQSLSHNPDLRHQLETHGSPDWTTYGENVGQGPANDPDALFKAYMNSTEHRDNILNRAYRFTGVSVILDGSSAWNTFDFVDTYHSTTRSSSTTVRPKPAPGPARPAPAPSSRSVAPATTSAPVTTSQVSRPTVAGSTARRPVRAPRAKPLPHTGSRPQADAAPNLAQLLSRGQRPTVVLAASVRTLPAPLPLPSQLGIAVAGLLLGFVGVRWWHLARAA
jgi:hypothetical protein